MIAAQLQLDVAEFGRHARAEGVDVASLEPYARLLATVAPPPDPAAAGAAEAGADAAAA